MNPPDGRYETPVALNTAITGKAKRKAEAEAEARGLIGKAASNFVGERTNQLRRDVAFHAVLKRLSHGSAQGVFVIKGGVALQLRLDPSRPSKDIDIAWMGEAIDRGLELTELRDALRRDEGDFFEFELDTGTAQVDEEGALVLPVVARLGGRQFERFSIDLAPSREGIEVEESLSHAPLGIDQLGVANVRLLQVEMQLADKICAIHENHSGVPSSRWRDLADIAMIAQQVEPIDTGRLVAAIESEVARRKMTLPNGLPGQLTLTEEQRGDWTKRWGRGGRPVPLTMDEAIASASQFVDPILGRQVDQGTWREQAWITITTP